MAKTSIMPGKVLRVEEGETIPTVLAKAATGGHLVLGAAGKRIEGEEAKKKKEEHEKAWANAPAPAIPEEPPFEDDEDLEAFFASRNVQTPLQRFDQLQADNAIAAAKKVLDEKEAERLRLIDKAAADAAVDAARKAITPKLPSNRAFPPGESHAESPARTACAV